MKKLKCEKCEIYFKDRKDPGDFISKNLCWNCRFILNTLALTAIALEDMGKKINRRITLNRDAIKIRKL